MNDRVFLLKKFPLKERDQVAVVLGEASGKITLLGKNSVQSKRFGNAFQPFQLFSVDLPEKTIRLQDYGESALHLVLGAQVERTFPTISRSLVKMATGSVLNETVLRAVPEQRESSELFKLYANAITAVDETDERACLQTLIAFLLKLTQWLGVQPTMTACGSCGVPVSELPSRGLGAYADYKVAQWKCSSCFSAQPFAGGEPIDVDLIFDFCLGLAHPIRRLEFKSEPAAQIRGLQFLETHYQFHVQGFDREPIRSLGFFRECYSL